MDGITLDDMKCFDFSVPLDEIIMYDDSDEDDKKTIISISDENDAPDIPERASSKNENYSQHQITYIAEQDNNQHRDMPNINKEIYSTSENLSQSQTKNITQVSNEQTNESDDGTKIAKNKVENHEAKCRKSRNANKLSKTNEDSDSLTACFTHKTSETASPSKKRKTVIKASSHDENANEDTESTIKTGHSSIIEITNTEDNVLSSTNNCGELSDYIKDIFDTISQNLIFSVEAYHHHLNKFNHLKKDQASAALQDSKKRYLSLKYHYFQLSYCAVVNIILPQETKNNIRFTESFLNNTVKYAKEKMNLVLNKRDLEPFYYELVTWAKKKKDSLKNAHNYSKLLEDQEKTISQTPLLVKQLAQPPLPFQVLPDYPNNRKVVDQSTHTTPIFRKGAPDQEVIISVDTSTANVVTNLANQIAPPVYSSVCNMSSTSGRTDLHHQDRYPKNSNPVQDTISNIIIHQARDFNGVVENIQNYGSLPHGYNNGIFQYNHPAPPIGPKSNSGQLMDQYRRTIQPKPYSPYCGLYNHVPSIPHQYSNQLPYAPAQQYPNQISYSQPPQLPSYNQTFNIQAKDKLYQSQAINRINQNQANNINIYQSQANERIHQNQVNDRIHQTPANDKIHTSQTALRDQYRQNELLNQSFESSRSSVSTDSGFASPPQFNCAKEPLVSPSSLDDRQLVPLITHVTSLNPKAMHIAEGSCHVCQKRTREKCLGCYQVYYCSTTCQLQDWSIHKVSCKV